MTNLQKLEDVECCVLNEKWIQLNQGVMKGMGGDIAALRSPGLKAQVSRYGPGRNELRVYCDNVCADSQNCHLTHERCIFYK